MVPVNLTAAPVRRPVRSRVSPAATSSVEMLISVQDCLATERPAVEVIMQGSLEESGVGAAVVKDRMAKKESVFRSILGAI
jgi:hypothetical protein